MSPSRSAPSRGRSTLSVVAKHPAAKWLGSVATLVVAGLLVVLLQPHHAGPSPVSRRVTLTASFKQDLYSEHANGFMGLLPANETVSSAMKSAPDCDRLHSLLARSGGADVSATYVRLYFQNGTRFPALVNEVRARIIQHLRERRVTPVSCTQGAGPLPTLPGIIKLDSSTPVVLAVKKAPGNSYGSVPAGPYFQSHIVNLAPGESFALDLAADPGRCFCVWQLVADLVVNGRTETVVAQDGTQPFRTAPYRRSPGVTCWALDFSARPHRLTPSSLGC